MTLQELEALRGHLDGLIAAGRALRKAGLMPAFDLTPGQGACILTDFVMPQGGAVVVAARATAATPPVTGDVGPVPCASEKVGAAPPARRKKVPEPASARVPVTGPLSADERAQIGRLREKGVAAAEIAALLNRRVQTVALFLSQAVKAEGSAVVKDVPPPYAPGPRQAVAEIPQVLPPSTRAPGPREAVAERPEVLPPAPPPGEPGVPGWLRELRAHLHQVAGGADWSRAADLRLVEGLAGGNGLDKVAVSLGVTRGGALDRWRVLAGPFMVDGVLPIDWQERLLRELRARAEREAA